MCAPARFALTPKSFPKSLHPKCLFETRYGPSDGRPMFFFDRFIRIYHRCEFFDCEAPIRLELEYFGETTLNST